MALQSISPECLSRWIDEREFGQCARLGKKGRALERGRQVALPHHEVGRADAGEDTGDDENGGERAIHGA